MQRTHRERRGIGNNLVGVAYSRICSQKAESLSYEIIENSPNGILVIDGDMRVMQMNNKAKRIWGVTERDPKGMLLLIFHLRGDIF